MSGLDEQEELWVLEYKEWLYEDWIYSFKGFMATSEEDAKKKADILLKYNNYNYTEDGESYKFIGVYKAKESFNFFETDEELKNMNKANLDYEAEMDEE